MGREVHRDHVEQRAVASRDAARTKRRDPLNVDLLDRAWEPRDNITAYDGMYVALAEAIRAPLVTCDRALASAPGHRARVEVI